MPHALVDLFFLKSDGITIFGKILYSNTLQSPPDPMGSKDTPIRKYVCVGALLSEQKLHDASALLYLVPLVFS